MTETALAIQHNPAAMRFEAVVEGMLCRTDYRMHGDTMMIVHTEVPQQLEGRGIASALVKAAFNHAADKGMPEGLARVLDMMNLRMSCGR